MAWAPAATHWSSPSPTGCRRTRRETGHLVKARYTPLQSMVLGADEQDSPDHAVLRDADDLFGTPVVVADLHSALPAVLAGVFETRPGTRVIYVMIDGGALPLAFSRTVSALRDAGWLGGIVTVGQAYGGDREAVTVHTGLLTERGPSDSGAGRARSGVSVPGCTMR